MARGITRDTDRHGNVRLYFRQRGRPKVRLHEPPGTAAFEDELAAARLGLPYSRQPKPRADGRPPRVTAPAGSLRWLVEEYLRRHVAGLAPSTRTKKRAVLEEICGETILSQSGRPAGMMAYRGLELRHVAMLRDVKVGLPAAADHRVKAISAMFRWAMEAGLATTNPAAGCGKLDKASSGHHSMTRDELARYEAAHPAGTMAHAAMMVFRYTGLRVCDAARLGRQHLYTLTLEDGSTEQRLRITPQKTAGSSGVAVDLPVLPPLAETLAWCIARQPPRAAGAPGRKTPLAFITNEFGAAFTVKGLGQRMRKWFDTAELPHCSSHSIRKADAVIAAENGATSKELQALFGWTSSREADRYTQAASRTKLSTSGAPHLLVRKPSPKPKPATDVSHLPEDGNKVGQNGV